MALDQEILEAMGGVDFDVEELREKYRAERDKRRRSDGIGQFEFVKVDDELATRIGDDPFVDPDWTREPVVDEIEVVIIGAGFSGLLAAAHLRDLGFEQIRLIDRAGDVGGTWYWNRYPGCQCDVESYIYLPRLEETGYMPRYRYSSATEIFEYCRLFARHYNLYEHALFRTGIAELEWDNSIERWIVHTDRGDRITARYVVMGNGSMMKPKLPGIPGLADFQGHTFHTSRWDYAYTGGNPSGNLFGLIDKRVAIIGTGASAVQVVPHLGEWAKQLYVFQRTPAQVGARENHKTDIEWVKTLKPGWQQERRDNYNALSVGVRTEVDLIDDYLSRVFLKVFPVAADKIAKKIGRRLTKAELSELLEINSFRLGEELRERVDETVRDSKTAELLKPWFRMLCKRPCPNDDYLATFNRPNVTLVDTAGHGVEKITANSIVVDGVAYEVDCLIWGSGFEVGTPFTHHVGYDIVGRDGIRLSDQWADGPHTVLGAHVRNFPNLFFMSTIQTAHNSNVTHMLDEQAKHVSYVIGQTRDRGIAVLEATEEGQQWWASQIAETSSGTQFDSECTPSYYNSEGNPDSPWGIPRNRYGGGAIKFNALLAAWRDSGDLRGLAEPSK